MQSGVVGNTQIPAKPNHRGRSGHNFGSSAAEIAGTRKDFVFIFQRENRVFYAEKFCQALSRKKILRKK
jgi:hypothetical protein